MPMSALASLPRSTCRNICLVGDFNAKHENWLPSQVSDAAGLRLFAFGVSHGLAQVVSEPTFTTSTGREVQLDLMFVNQPSLVQSCTTLAPLADHRPTLLQLSCGGGTLFVTISVLTMMVFVVPCVDRTGVLFVCAPTLPLQLLSGLVCYRRCWINTSLGRE